MNGCPQQDPGVSSQGEEKSEMSPHDVEPVLQTLAVPFFRHPAHEVIGNDNTGIDGFAAFFQDSDAPIVISAEVALDVRGSNGSSGDEGLVDDAHTAEVLPPMQLCRQFARAQLAHHAGGATAVVHQQRFAVDDVCVVGGQGSDGADSFRTVEVVPAVEELDEVSGGKSKAFVHGIVKALVGLRHPFQPGHEGCVFANDGDSSIGGGAVHNDVLDVWPGLLPDAFEGSAQQFFPVEHNGDDGEGRRATWISRAVSRCHVALSDEAGGQGCFLFQSQGLASGFEDWGLSLFLAGKYSEISAGLAAVAVPVEGIHLCLCDDGKSYLTLDFGLV